MHTSLKGIAEVHPGMFGILPLGGSGSGMVNTNTSRLGGLGAAMWTLLWVTGLMFGWAIGLASTFRLAAVELPIVRTNPEGLLLLTIGTIPFAASTAAWHLAISKPYIPANSTLRWFLSMFLGSVLYCLSTWILLTLASNVSSITNGASGEQSLESVSVPFRDVIASGIGGILIGTISAALLVALQKPMLRRHIYRSPWWIFGLLMINATFMGAILGVSAWLSRGSGWL